MNGWLVALITAIITSGLAFAAQIAVVRSNKQGNAATAEESEAHSIDTISGRAVDLTMKVIELGERVGTLSRDNSQMSAEIKRLTAEVQNLTISNDLLTKEIHSLRFQISDKGDIPK